MPLTWHAPLLPLLLLPPLAVLAAGCAPAAGAATGGPSGSAVVSASLPKARGADGQPAAAVLAQGDLGGHLITAGTQDGALPGVDRPECRALAYAAVGFLPAGRTGWARASVVAESLPLPAGATERERGQAALDAASSTVTVVTLGSYAGDRAGEHLAEVRAAGPACEGGYSATGGGRTVRVTEVVPVAVPTGSGAGVGAGRADEAVAYSVRAESGGESYETEVVVARKGGTLVNFYAARPSGEVDLPGAVVDAQVGKLG
ncbi:hypothetical protein OOK31_13770 [Streptomyces sp. NBC_00249]|nr:hypothetical protein [Streptomyces sp. NBC_00249]